MKTLHLTLKKKWFDMIASGEKKEEYREIKPYWASRLTTLPKEWTDDCINKIEDCAEWTQFFNEVVFRNGYTKNAPTMKFKCEYITIALGRVKWGAEPGKKYFVIKLGDRL
jgi:hypothetical protein